MVILVNIYGFPEVAETFSLQNDNYSETVKKIPKHVLSLKRSLCANYKLVHLLNVWSRGKQLFVTSYKKSCAKIHVKILSSSDKKKPV